jgi:hypothetical protein
MVVVRHAKPMVMCSVRHARSAAKRMGLGELPKPDLVLPVVHLCMKTKFHRLPSLREVTCVSRCDAPPRSPAAMLSNSQRVSAKTC